GGGGQKSVYFMPSQGAGTRAGGVIEAGRSGQKSAYFVPGQTSS
ncbi:unnamed protein product, partial [Onchocerca ochengi]|uniref:Uncharacterized protein n=1 Tax=Onchocerca ochengi TaxID=42157 RepID=A0A182EQT3_ONCOC